MTVINGSALIEHNPIKEMRATKLSNNLVTYGLGEAGYDIRIKQDIHFKLRTPTVLGIKLSFLPKTCSIIRSDEFDPSSNSVEQGRFCLASAIEEFRMPDNLVGIVHDKSSWARRGLSVFNTVIEPGWNGFLTLELVYSGEEDLFIPAGSGIAQVIFHEITERTNYTGRYQGQADKPVEAIEVHA